MRTISADAFFSSDFFAARDRFRQAVVASSGKLEVLQLDAKGPNGEDLAIDIGWFGSAEPRRALVHSSGLHGIEGLAGSAVQLQFLQTLKAFPKDTALIFAHVLNPYGMAWRRRVNENNVDLNRNFKEEGSYSGAPGTYSKLNSFLNPEGPPRTDFYYLKTAYLVARFGMAALRQSIVGGQYEYPRGLFFGGKHIEQGPSLYQSFLKERLTSIERLFVIDVHTGLGRFGVDSLLVETRNYAYLRERFGPSVTKLLPHAGPAYRVDGGLQSMVFRIFAEASPLFIGQEFGTYSGARVLRALRDENRWHHFGTGRLDHPSKQALQKTFCPDDSSWRRAVLTRGQEVLEQAMVELIDGKP